MLGKNIVLDSTAQRYYENHAGYKYADRQRYRPPFQRIVLGKIEFVGMVKGKNSPVYRDLLRWFAHVSAGYGKRVDVSETSQLGVLVYTEGKTDGKHFSAALRSFQKDKMFPHISLTCLDNHGFDDLEKRLDFTVAVQRKIQSLTSLYLIEMSVKVFIKKLAEMNSTNLGGMGFIQWFFLFQSIESKHQK